MPPTELISRILGHTSARDVIRWRTVSKWFRAITYQINVWKSLHANVSFMPPPGSLLERALVKSERLAKSWGHQIQQLRVLSVHTIHFDGGLPFDFSNHLVDGRWFIACQSNRRFVLYDTHSIINKTHAAPPTVLWEQSDKIEWWVSSPGAYREGRWVVYVWLQFVHTMQHYVFVLCESVAPHVLFSGTNSSESLLELEWDADSGSLCNTIASDIPCDLLSTVFTATPNINFKYSRFLHMRAPRLVFDTITRIFYTIPPFKLALDQTKSIIHATLCAHTVELTNTHVILLYDHWVEETSKVVVAQAFTIPDDQLPVNVNGKNELHLTHEGVFKSRDTIFNVIRNSVVDSLTGSVHVKLLERDQWEDCAFEDLYCIDLTLHAHGPSVADVLPMTITRQSVDLEGCIPAEETLSRCTNMHWDISDEGYARCLFLVDHSYTIEPTCCPKPVVAKLAIDVTGDRCVAVYGVEVEVETRMPEMYDLLTSYGFDTKFDGTRGRFYDLYSVEGGHISIVDVE